MTTFKQKLKLAVVGITQSPLDILSEFGRRLLPEGKDASQVLRIRGIARATPLILQIETINVCNAACVFCGYKSMKRKKGVMSMPLFEKVVKDYAYMGGGPVSLTPVGGDALLDPHLVERIRILDVNPEINQISLTTNAIALERYSDEDVCYILKALDCIQVSIGGLDAATYGTMYAVDCFENVQSAMERLLKLRNLVSSPANITFAFRTNDWGFELHFKRKIAEYRRRGVFISHIWMYANYSGLVKSDERRNLVVLGSGERQQTSCLYGCISMAVCWDGRITACGCADIEANALAIGNAAEDSLSDVWSGNRRLEIFDSFSKGKPAEICRNCSAYLPDASVFSRPYFRKYRPHEHLPLEFFHQFWGG
jgi:MoaA/NifB/PqqE/SkfB family radical SAM enzyme